MKKDIEIPVVTDVYVAIVHDWNQEFKDKEWVAYLINNKKEPIEMAMVVSKGFDGNQKTSVMRHTIPIVAAKSFEKIEVVQEDVLAFNNEFFVTFFMDNRLYEKRFVFKKGSVSRNLLQPVLLLEKEGVLAS